MDSIVAVIFYLMAGLIIVNVGEDIYKKNNHHHLPSLTNNLIILLWPLWLLWHFFIETIKLVKGN